MTTMKFVLSPRCSGIGSLDVERRATELTFADRCVTIASCILARSDSGAADRLIVCSRARRAISYLYISNSRRNYRSHRTNLCGEK